MVIYCQMAHNGNIFEYSAMQNVWSSNSDGRQITESINLRPTPWTAPGPQLSGDLFLSLLCQTKGYHIKLGISKIANHNSSSIATKVR